MPTIKRVMVPSSIPRPLMCPSVKQLQAGDAGPGTGGVVIVWASGAAVEAVPLAASVADGVVGSVPPLTAHPHHTHNNNQTSGRRIRVGPSLGLL